VTIYVAPAFALVGLLAYALSASGKVAEVGRIMFAVGSLATLLLLCGAHPLRFP
jgi:hypothetical protein